jgi:putative DNA primase/helicase
MDFENKIADEIKSKLGEDSPTIIFDGKIHRFGKNKRAWYIADTTVFKSKTYFDITFGSWNVDGKHQLSSKDGGEAKEDKEFTAMMKKKREELRIKNALETIELHKKCIDKWKPIFHNAEQGKIHDYLIQKNIKHTFGSRVTKDNVLLIPAYKGTQLVGVQRIFQMDGLYVKRFSYGIEKRGAIVALKNYRFALKCFLAEGFATACSIQECFPKIPVLCAFDAGNIIPAIETIKAMAPNIKIMIAADNDTESQTGVKYAKKAVKQFSNVSFRLPIFKDNQGGKLTDFNDLKTVEGCEKVIKILKY